MKKTAFISCLIFIIVVAASTGAFDARVYFSPKGGSAEAVEKVIDDAKESVDVAMYAFTSRQLAKALIRAKERGVKTRVILDGEFNQNEFSKGNFLIKNKVNVLITRRVKENTGDKASKYGIEGKMHNKFAVIDSRLVITGSYNWTASAEVRNDENLLIFTEPASLIQAYEKEFEKLWGKSEGQSAKGIVRRAKGKGEGDDGRMGDGKEHRAEGREHRAEGKGALVIPATYLEGLRKAAGKEALVHGRVVKVHHSSRSNTFFLQFGPKGRSFTGVIFNETAGKFIEAGHNPLNYEDKEVEIFGEIEDHPKYGLEIIIEGLEQIKIVK